MVSASALLAKCMQSLDLNNANLRGQNPSGNRYVHHLGCIGPEAFESPLWSAGTCRRFGPRRLDAASLARIWLTGQRLRQVAPTKALTGQRTPNFALLSQVIETSCSTCLNSGSPVNKRAFFCFARAAAKQSAKDILCLDLKPPAS